MRAAASKLEWSEAKMWRIETGQTPLRSLDVQAMCLVYGASADLTEALMGLAKETKALGGYLNAYTYYDRTCYYTVVPADNAVKALEIQSDALLHSSFDAEELRREIEVVIQENNRKLDNPDAVASEKLFEVAFTQHRMRRWRILPPAYARTSAPFVSRTRNCVFGSTSRTVPSISIIASLPKRSVLA